MTAISARTEQLLCLGAETQAKAFFSPAHCHLHVELTTKHEITHFTQSKRQKMTSGKQDFSSTCLTSCAKDDRLDFAIQFTLSICISTITVTTHKHKTFVLMCCHKSFVNNTNAIQSNLVLLYFLSQLWGYTNLSNNQFQPSMINILLANWCSELAAVSPVCLSANLTTQWTKDWSETGAVRSSTLGWEMFFFFSNRTPSRCWSANTDRLIRMWSTLNYPAILAAVNKQSVFRQESRLFTGEAARWQANKTESASAEC